MAEKNNVTYKGMPHNPEAEQALLGSILIDNHAADLLIPTLRESDFFIAANRLVFAAMRELQEASKPVDTVSVADMLEQHGKLDEAGSIDYLTELADSVPSAASGDHYADIVKRDSLIRRVISAGNNIAKKGYESVDGTDALLNAEREIYSISEDISEKELVRADVALGVAMKNIQDAQAGVVSKNVVNTDFPSLDRMSRGFKPGELILIAARPSVGKTAFALNIAANACLNHNKTVAIFSLEMPAHLLVKRTLAYVSKVSLSAMDQWGGLTPADTGKLYDAYRRLSETNLYIDDYSMNTPTDVLSKCRRLKRESGLDLIIIDYLQLMSNGGRGRANESRQLEVSEMSRSMKIYAKELDVPIVLLSQMSRGVEQRNDHTPKLSDLRESGAIEQDADMVMFLHRENQFNPAVPENLIQLLIRKNRNGPIGDVNLEWEGATTTFRECVDGVMPATSSAPSSAPAPSPRPDYAAAAAKEEEREEEKNAPVRDDGEDAFLEDVTETDGGLMPFGDAASFGDAAPAPDDDDAPPFDTEEEEAAKDDETPEDDGDEYDDSAEELAYEEYEDEYSDDEEEDEDLPF